MVKIKDITSYLEQYAPLSYQESYDNSGLITGDVDWKVSAILITLDCTEAVVEEAVETGCNLILAHHPIWFSPMKRLSGGSYVERTIIKAIKHDIAIYAIHTNLDNVLAGVNQKLAEKIGLRDTYILAPKSSTLMKLVTFCPAEDTEQVLEALHRAGAGNIGNYQECSFVGEGTGSFRPNPEANPHIGSKGQLEKVPEQRIEVLFPGHRQQVIMNALQQSHPYEEVAYYLHQVENPNQDVGSGMTGTLEQSMSAENFLKHLKQTIGTPVLKHSPLLGPIEKVGICGGAGSFLIRSAIRQSCDAFVTADLKYHDYFEADGKILLVDIGHHESEVSTKDLLGDIITKNFSKFAVRLSKVDTNPVRYF